jgi:hypothetical protein
MKAAVQVQQLYPVPGTRYQHLGDTLFHSTQEPVAYRGTGIGTIVVTQGGVKSVPLGPCCGTVMDPGSVNFCVAAYKYNRRYRFLGIEICILQHPRRVRPRLVGTYPGPVVQVFRYQGELIHMHRMLFGCVCVLSAVTFTATVLRVAQCIVFPPLRYTCTGEPTAPMQSCRFLPG